MPVIDYAEKYPIEEKQEKEKEEKAGKSSLSKMIDDLYEISKDISLTQTNSNNFDVEHDTETIEFKDYGGPYKWKDCEDFFKGPSIKLEPEPLSFKPENHNNSGPWYYASEAPLSSNAKALEKSLNEKSKLITWIVSPAEYPHKATYDVKASTTIAGEKIWVVTSIYEELIQEVDEAVKMLNDVVASQIAGAIRDKELEEG